MRKRTLLVLGILTIAGEVWFAIWLENLIRAVR